MTFGVVLLVVALICVVIVAAWAFHTAQRLHRLHIRLDRSRDALQAALDRRCAVVAALFPELAKQAHETEALRFSSKDLRLRLGAEGDLMQAVRESSQSSGDVPAELRDAHTRVELARRFYNDAVADTLALQLRPLVRFFRLGGTAVVPQFATDGQ